MPCVMTSTTETNRQWKRGRSTQAEAGFLGGVASGGGRADGPVWGHHCITPLDGLTVGGCCAPHRDATLRP